MASLGGGGPCTTRPQDGFRIPQIDKEYGVGCDIQGNGYSVDGYSQAKGFFFGGRSDSVLGFDVLKETANWHESMGMKVKKVWKQGFEHVYPNDIPGHEEINPEQDCSIWWDELGSNNCEFDVAYEFLTYFFGDLNERIFDDDIYRNGSLYAIDQTAFFVDETEKECSTLES